jgi:hypothetical protein
MLAYIALSLSIAALALFEAELPKQIGPAKRELIEALLAKERAKLAATNPRQNPGRKMLLLEGITRWNRMIEMVTRLARLANSAADLFLDYWYSRSLWFADIQQLLASISAKENPRT